MSSADLPDGGDCAHLAARSAREVLEVAGSHRAARLAAGLNGARVAFRCAQMARESWRFTVTVDALPQLLALHAELGLGGAAEPRRRAQARRPKC